MGRKPHLDQALREGLKKFKEKSGIDKVIVFGSVAKGEASKHSDVDLVLVDDRFRGKDFFERARGLYKYWDSKYPVDFLCYTPEEFEKLEGQVSIVREAVRTGVSVEA